MRGIFGRVAVVVAASAVATTVGVSPAGAAVPPAPSSFETPPSGEVVGEPIVTSGLNASPDGDSSAAALAGSDCFYHWHNGTIFLASGKAFGAEGVDTIGMKASTTADTLFGIGSQTSNVHVGLIQDTVLVPNSPPAEAGSSGFIEVHWAMSGYHRVANEEGSLPLIQPTSTADSTALGTVTVKTETETTTVILYQKEVSGRTEFTTGIRESYARIPFFHRWNAGIRFTIDLYNYSFAKGNLLAPLTAAHSFTDYFSENTGPRGLWADAIRWHYDIPVSCDPRTI